MNRRGFLASVAVAPVLTAIRPLQVTGPASRGFQSGRYTDAAFSCDRFGLAVHAEAPGHVSVTGLPTGSKLAGLNVSRVDGDVFDIRATLLFVS